MIQTQGSYHLWLPFFSAIVFPNIIGDKTMKHVPITIRRALNSKAVDTIASYVPWLLFAAAIYFLR